MFYNILEINHNIPNLGSEYINTETRKAFTVTGYLYFTQEGGFKTTINKEKADYILVINHTNNDPLAHPYHRIYSIEDIRQGLLKLIPI